HPGVMPNSLAAQDSPSHTHGRLDHEAVGLASPSSMEGVFHKVTLIVVLCTKLRSISALKIQLNLSMGVL
ncbi:MAG: hypothetical protein JRN61_06045, partial [Nitrososphaerota archaeon]|nr:hypothetical protein [Nitrososphaerota archaeon]